MKLKDQLSAINVNETYIEITKGDKDTTLFCNFPYSSNALVSKDMFKTELKKIVSEYGEVNVSLDSGCDFCEGFSYLIIKLENENIERVRKHRKDYENVIYELNISPSEELVVGITQTGQSPDIGGNIKSYYQEYDKVKK